MAWRPKIERVLWFVAAVLCVLGLLGWVRAMGIWYEYGDILPRSPNLATGNIYPLNIHGWVVYQTLRELSRRQRWEFWSMAMAAFGAALGAALKRLSARVGSR